MPSTSIIQPDMIRVCSNGLVHESNGTAKTVLRTISTTISTPYFIPSSSTSASSFNYSICTGTTTAATSSSIYIASNGTWFRADTSWYDAANTLNHFKPFIKPGIKKSTKNSIKRALKLMIGMGFEEEARIFLKGDTIEVAHPESILKFVIKKYRNSLIQRTEYPGCSTPYKLGLYTKSDVHVADLCVYMENTPILDQVLGVAMFIKSGSEEMILQKANWRNLNADKELKEILALEYPYLESKLRLNFTNYIHYDNSNPAAMRSAA